MFATKTRPSMRKLAASTMPVISVRMSRSGGNGPSRLPGLGHSVSEISDQMLIGRA